MRKPPCADYLPDDCPNRCAEPNCHTTCVEFIKWQSDRAEEENRIKALKKADDDCRWLKVNGALESQKIARRMKGRKT